MSVERVSLNISIDTVCPIVINSSESILSFKTASTIATNSNVNSRMASCYPTDYAYQLVYTDNQAGKCCNNVINNNNSYVNMSMARGY